jgi:hypothetical protein
MTTSATAYKWRFFRAGGFDQVKLDTGADLMNLDQLDQKLWVALACPTTGIEFDARTAALIDTDKDGRIRASELIAAVKWAGSMLKNPDDLVNGGDRLALDAISDATPESRQLLASAKHILVNLGQKDAPTISLADASDANRIFANTTFNGDGVIILESASDAATQSVIADIAVLFGTVADRSGKAGIDQARADAFFAAAKAFDAWIQKADANAVHILPAGAGTAAASAAVKAIKAKVDDYFGRCRLAAFDPRTVALLNRSEAEYAAIVGKDLSIHADEIAGFPLAQIAAHRPLPLKTGINPAHADALANLVNHAIQPLLGDRTELTEADWAALQARLAAFETWNAAKTGAAVEKLGIARVREILAAGAPEKINQLIAQDQALEPQATSTANVEKLIRFVRDLHRLCINFVNFRDLYDGGDPAVFQCGTLYLDQRSCNLCIPVADAGKHAVMAGLAGAYLAYCDCVRQGTGEKLSLVAIFSQGDDDNLMVGRNGIFYDRKGRDYDATITKILSNPISLRQAFWSPYKKLVRWIEEQIAKRAAEADTDVNTNLAAAAAAPVAPPAKKMAFDPSVIALISVALGSLAAAAAAFAAFLGKFPAWQIPLVVIGIMLLISGPSMILAFIKLRKRNLGPILDANGWAVNAKAKINVPFGTSLTGIAKLPAGAKVDISDRYAEKSSVLPKLAVTLFLVWWAYSYLNEEGWIYSWTNGSYGIKSAVQIQHDADAKQKVELEAARQKAELETKNNAAAQPSPTPATTPLTTTNAVPVK